MSDIKVAVRVIALYSKTRDGRCAIADGASVEQVRRVAAASCVSVGFQEGQAIGIALLKAGLEGVVTTIALGRVVPLTLAEIREGNVESDPGRRYRMGVYAWRQDLGGPVGSNTHLKVSRLVAHVACRQRQIRSNRILGHQVVPHRIGRLEVGL